ncbi:DNA mismatch repair endonuclease MutL [Mycoplasmatota bacterium]|nr:DNA mismatch repair endonuclease MutL [Mycoplasmatota bacterium]
MSVIKKMDHKLSNMIAAGEVVERPSSVIKELVENAIDAHATKIKIEVLGFGMEKISVTDNGDGMSQEDAKLAFERYATSKIKSEMDLSHIHTLGFRGEALAAISAVSKVVLKTKTEDDLGSEVIYEGGNFVSSSQAAMNKGTQIDVMNLFYNTPARFKYIKSEYTEKYAIIDIFDRLALANPSIYMQLSFDGKLYKETYGNHDFYQLIDQIYGKQMTKGLTIASHEVSHIQMKAYLLSPHIVRSRKKDISIFINHRYIKNYRLTQAVIDGYHSFLMVSKYPIAIIDIVMDPSLLDVNVHPQKYEVKFVNETFLSFELENMIKKALQEKNLPIQENLSSIKKEWKQESFTRPSLLNEAPMINENDENSSEPLNKLPYLEYIGIFSGTYLLFQNDEGLYLMDQHAAAERIRYEHYYEALGNPKFAIKERLIPIELSLSNDDIDKLLSYEKILNKHGFNFHQKQLISTPTWLRDEEIDIAIESIFSQLDEYQKLDIKTLRDALAKDVSCKGAIKANHHISRQEVFKILEELRLCKNPYTCPHGRPTIIKLTHYEIERMFKRVVS